MKEKQMRTLRKEIQTGYNKLARQQTECNRLDELANRLRITLEILKE